MGSYLVTKALTFNLDDELAIRFLGEIGTLIFGSVNGYIFDRHLGSPNNTKGGRIFEKLSITNSHATGGAIRLGSTNGGAVRNCQINGHIGFTAEDTAGSSSERIFIQSCTFAGGGTVSGSRAVILGGGGVLESSNLRSYDIAHIGYGSGLHIAGCRSENCNTSFRFGLDSADSSSIGMSGLSMHSTTTEGCWTAFHIAGPTNGFSLTSCGHLGHDIGNAGATQVDQASQYGFKLDANCATAGVLQGCTAANHHDQYGFSIAGATNRANVAIRECSSIVNTGSNWSLPSTAHTATFFNNNVQPIWTYSQLPTGGNVLEGDEFDISDANTTTWGANVTSGGGQVASAFDTMVPTIRSSVSNDHHSFSVVCLPNCGWFYFTYFARQAFRDL
jgi:hypothetical protein